MTVKRTIPLSTKTIKPSLDFQAIKTSKLRVGFSSISVRLVLQEKQESNQLNSELNVNYIVKKELGKAVQRNRVKRRIRGAVYFVFSRETFYGNYLLIARGFSLTCSFIKLVDDLRFSLFYLNNSLVGNRYK